MQAVVDSVLRVSTMIEEISQASREQTDGIEQINQAVSQMDQGTQQNAALVEQAAAAAASLQQQAQELTQVVATFQLGSSQGGRTPHFRRAPPPCGCPEPLHTPRPPWRGAAMRQITDRL